MQHLLRVLLLVALLGFGTAQAQEEDDDSATFSAGNRLQLATEGFFERTGSHGTEGTIVMTSPYVCTYRDFPVTERTSSEYVGLILRVLQGECPGNVHAYVHNRNPNIEHPRVGRIIVLTDDEAVTLLERIAPESAELTSVPLAANAGPVTPP